jgi:hypothetical protein
VFPSFPRSCRPSVPDSSPSCSEFAESLEEADLEAIEASLPPSEGQTAESRHKVAALIAAGGLSKVARLDTCVTVVSAVSFLDDFDTDHFLSDRHGDQVTPEDERNVTDLYVSTSPRPVRPADDEVDKR